MIFDWAANENQDIVTLQSKSTCIRLMKKNLCSSQSSITRGLIKSLRAKSYAGLLRDFLPPQLFKLNKHTTLNTVCVICCCGVLPHLVYFEKSRAKILAQARKGAYDRENETIHSAGYECHTWRARAEKSGFIALTNYDDTQH